MIKEDDSAKPRQEHKHIQLMSAIEHLDNAVEGLINLCCNVSGSLTEVPKKETVTEHDSLQSVLSGAPVRIHELANTLQSYTKDLKDKIF